jgi:hypothetical protein
MLILPATQPCLKVTNRRTRYRHGAADDGGERHPEPNFAGVFIANGRAHDGKPASGRFTLTRHYAARSDASLAIVPYHSHDACYPYRDLCDTRDTIDGI